MDDESHIAVPHAVGVVILRTTVKQLREIGRVPQPRVSEGKEAWLGGVTVSRSVVKVPRETISTSHLDGFGEVSQYPEIL